MKTLLFVLTFCLLTMPVFGMEKTSELNRIFESVPKQYKEVFKAEVKKLFDSNLMLLKKLLGEQKFKSVFMVHDCDPQIVDFSSKQISQIDAKLKLAGIKSLLDLVDCRPGGNLSEHQFANQIFDSEIESIIVVGSGRRRDELFKSSDFVAGQIIEAQKRKTRQPILLTLGNLDQSEAFSSLLLNIPSYKSISVHSKEAKLKLYDLIPKTYELIKAIYNNELVSVISKAEEALYRELKNISENEFLQKRLEEARAASQRENDDLALLLGL